MKSSIAALAPADADRIDRRVIAVVNGKASGVDAPNHLAARVVTALRDAGAAAEGVVTQTEDQLHEILACAGDARVILVGGDGSVHTACNAPVDLPELGLVPVGRANNTARQLGIPDDDVAAAATIAVRGKARALDVLRVETADGTRRCVEAVSAGLQADARGSYEGENSAQLLAGLRAAAGAILRYRPYEVELEVDGRPAFAGPVGQLFVANLALFGFGFAVNPAARATDGCLEVVIMQAPTRRAAVALLRRAYNGRHVQCAQTTVLRGRRVRVTTALPAVCDAQPIGERPFDVAVEPRRLRIAAGGPA